MQKYFKYIHLYIDVFKFDCATEIFNSVAYNLQPNYRAPLFDFIENSKKLQFITISEINYPAKIIRLI